MHFVPDEQQAMIQSGVRAFAEGTLKPSAPARDVAGTTSAELRAQLAELGVFGLSIPESAGGLGLDAGAVVLALEELGAADAGLGLLVVEQHQLAARYLARVAQSAMHQEWLQSLATGRVFCAWAHGESTAHRDTGLVQTKATRTVDGWTLTGTKSDVWGAGSAAVAIVTAQTDAGLGTFAVVLDAPGVTRTSPTDPLGLRSLGVATLTLDQVAVPDAYVLGTPGQVDADIAHVTLHASLGVAALAVGIAREALRLGGRYANERTQFGKPIVAFQPIQWQVANSAVDLETARLLVYRAAWALDAGAKSAASSVRMARLAATEAATRVADRAIQMHGGYGYTQEFGVERLYRDAWTLDGLHGSPGWQRIELARGLAAAV